MIKDKTVVKRFWKKVNKTRHCWLWMGRQNSYGYGTLMRDGKYGSLVHRLSWEIHRGPIPKGNHFRGMFVCHSCDIRNCVNPKHLFLGEIYENNMDRTRKGRDARGENHGRAKLNNVSVKKIRKLYKSGLANQKYLANKFGVNQTKISNVILRKSWAHVK